MGLMKYLLHFTTKGSIEGFKEAGMLRSIFGQVDKVDGSKGCYHQENTTLNH